jgi:hypothetical protein
MSANILAEGEAAMQKQHRRAFAAIEPRRHIRSQGSPVRRVVD